MKKAIPKFKSEQAERKFWENHDSTDYVDWSKAKPITLSNLSPSVKNISLRLPESMLEEIKLLANKKDVPALSISDEGFFSRADQGRVGSLNRPSCRQAFVRRSVIGYVHRFPFSLYSHFCHR